MKKFSRGYPLPFGPSKHPKGINFALFSKEERQFLCVSLSLTISPPPSRSLSTPKSIKRGMFRHVFVYDLPDNTRYGYRLDGPYDPLKGHHFDKRVVVLDPYAKLVAGNNQWGDPYHASSSKIHTGIVYPLELSTGRGYSPQYPHERFGDL